MKYDSVGHSARFGTYVVQVMEAQTVTLMSDILGGPNKTTD